jgi:hypothetical protein
MPITFRIDNESGIVYTTVEGRVGIDEIIEKLKDFMNRPEFRPGLNGIADMRNSDLETHSIDVQRIARLMIDFRDKIGPSKTAVVVSQKVTFGMTRMFQVFAEQSSIDTAIFQDMDEALQWLAGSKGSAGKRI